MPNGQQPLWKPPIGPLRPPPMLPTPPWPKPVIKPAEAGLVDWQLSQSYWQTEVEAREERLRGLPPTGIWEPIRVKPVTGIPELEVPLREAYEYGKRVVETGLGIVGKYVPSIYKPPPPPEMPPEYRAAIEGLDAAVVELGRSSFFTNLYSAAEFLVSTGTIASLEDYFEYIKAPMSTLNEQDLSVARSFVSNLVAKEGEEVEIEVEGEWLTVTEAEKAAVEKFLAPVKITPLPMHRVSVDEIIKALTTSAMPTLPEGMSDEELLRVMSVLGIPGDTLTEAVDVMELIAPLSEAAAEQTANIEAVLAGLRKWEMPKSDLKELMLFTFMSPMQAAADLIQPYLEKVSYPMAGLATYTVQQLLPGTQAFEAEVWRRKTALGESPYDALRYTWKEWDLNPGAKLVVEILTDPITYTPGLLISVPGKAFKATRLVGLSELGRGMLAFNQGMWNVLDIPFDAFKAIWAGRKVGIVPGIPKASTQIVTGELNDFRGTLFAAITKRNPAIGVAGRTLDKITAEDIAGAIRYSLEAARKAGPNDLGDIYVKLGRMLLRHPPLEPDEILIWSRAVGGRLAKEQITHSLVDDINNILLDTVENFGNLAMNAKRMAMALQAEDSPKVLRNLADKIKRHTWKYSARVGAVIELGKVAKISPQLRMLDALVTQQRKILQATITSTYYKARRFSGTIATMINEVDRMERNIWRVRLDRYMVRPVAEAYLGNTSYAIWNIFEGMFVSALEGIVPRRAQSEAFLQVFQGIDVVDPAMINWALKKGYAGDPSGMFGRTAPGRAGAYSILPGKIPEEVVGAKLPAWIGGKDYAEWLGRRWIEISDIWGSAFRANFLMKKMARYLAEYSVDVNGVDVNKALTKLIKGGGGAPDFASAKRLGLTKHVLEQDMFQRISVSKEAVLDAKNYLTNSSLIQGEQLKILRQATELSPQSRTVMEQLIQQGKLLQTEDSIVAGCKLTAQQSIEDLAQYSVKVADSFAALADDVTRMEIANADDLMQAFQHYEVTVEAASELPSKLLSKTFAEADELKALGKFPQIEKLWRTGRKEMEDTVQSVDASMEIMRNRILNNTHLLKPEQRAALESLLDKASARDSLREGWLAADGQLLDDFWALKKEGIKLTPQDHTDLRALRHENWIIYRKERAVLGASEYQAKRDYSQLYYNLPTPKFLRVEAAGRALSAQDVANIMGCNVDALTNGILDVMTMQDRYYFIQMVKQQAERYPKIFKGITEDKIGAVYDDLLKGLHLKPDIDIAAQKMLQQAEGMKQQLLYLRANKSLNPTEERALHQWVDRVASGRDSIIGKKPVPITPRYDGLRGEPVSELKRVIAGTKDIFNMEQGAFVPREAEQLITQLESIPYKGGRIYFRKGERAKADQFIVGYEQLAEDFRLGKVVGEEWDVRLGRLYGYSEADISFYLKRARGVEARAPEVGALVSEMEWDVIRQKAAHSAHVDYYKAFADYTNQNIVDVAGKFIFPFWSYHMYRWFYLSRLFIRRPGMAAAWGKYYNYSDYGYVHIPNTDLEINPFVGSVFGATFGLARHDFKSYYENLGWLGEGLDFMQRRGFFPGIHIMLPVVLSPLLTGRPPELGEALPPLHRFGLNLLQASPIEGVRDAAKWLQDRVFHDNFRDYYTATLVSGMQTEAGGLLIDGQSGIDLWHKIQRGEKLTEEEQQVWDDASRETAWYNMLRSQFPIFRLREEEMLDAFKQVTRIIEEQLGLSAEYQDWLWRHNMRPTDVVGGLPLDLKMTLDEMWQWKIWFGRGQILMPPGISNLYGLINKYWGKVESFQNDRLTTQLDTDQGFLAPTPEIHYDGREWRREYANNWSTYVARTEALEKDPEFVDAIDAMTPEGQVRLAKELGFSSPVRGPMEEAIDLYFDIELEKRTDPYTGEEDWDYLEFWLKREAVRMALTVEQRADFDAYISRYQTPMERVFKDVTNRYFRGYRGVSRIIFDTYDEEYQALIREFYADTTSLTRTEEIREFITPDGRKLMSEFESKMSDARLKLRLASPELDKWLYIFGYVTTLKTPEAREMVDKWEQDKGSIVTDIEPTAVLERRIELLPERTQ